MELAMTELKLVSIFLTRSFDIREAWDEWDKERYVLPSYIVNRLVLARDGVYHQSTRQVASHIGTDILHLTYYRGKLSTPTHKVNGERLYQTGRVAVHPKDGMPVQIRRRK